MPLEEVRGDQLNYNVPSEIKGYWPQLVAKALADNLGPILIFAPRRADTEALAMELAKFLPNPNPLSLSAPQRDLVGEPLARLLKARIAWHHSGLSYGARAGVIEPLAKAGQLRAVVATMGLAAGINFSLRSVALAAASYRRDFAEQPLRPDELLQMFGRAGRRGLDETGYVLVTANEVRMREGYPCHLARSGLVDWGALLTVMRAAAAQGRDPFADAVRVQTRLFTTRPVFLGVEAAMKFPDAPCGLRTDSERARHVRRLVREMLNSAGEWEKFPPVQEKRLGEIRVPCAELHEQVRESSALGGAGCAATGDGSQREPSHRVPDLASEITGHETRPLLSDATALAETGTGNLCVLSEQGGLKTHGRALVVADKLHDDRVVIAKWIRRLTNWTGRQATMDDWRARISPLISKKLAAQRTPVVRFGEHGLRIVAEVDIAGLTAKVPVDRHGVALWRPREREVLPTDCAACPQTDACRELSAATGVALLWRRLGLVDAAGAPTARGRVVSFLHGSDGLAIAAALEDAHYPLDELIYDIANLDAGFRFCGEENRLEGRLVVACRKTYGLQTIPGYLEDGAPPKYGSGAESVVASVHKDPLTKHRWVSGIIGAGDVDRAIIEWRSLLRQIAHSPPMEWPRWTALQAMAKGILSETESPTLTDLPPLEFNQTRRTEHTLRFRRH